MQHAAAPDPTPATPLEHGPALYRHMLRARVVSSRMVALQRRGVIGYHSASIGDEAAIVGAALAMRPGDWVFPSVREWYAALARGLPLGAYVHHAFGSAQDPAKGHSAPDHAPARAHRVVPPSGVAGAHLPQAVGAAWAAKIAREDVAVLALFGAEVAEGGDFHNAMNFAGVFKTPVVFVGRAAPGKALADRAVAYGLANAQVDGGDALAVFAVVKAALARAVDGKGATLIEVVMPSFPELASRDDDAFVGGDLVDLGASDPLTRLRKAIGAAAPDVADVKRELDEAIAAAERAGAPSPATIFENVYAGVPAHLAAQRRNLTGG